MESQFARPLEVGDVVATTGGGLHCVVIAIDETAAGVRIVRTQRTFRETRLESEVYRTPGWTEKYRDELLNGRDGW